MSTMDDPELDDASETKKGGDNKIPGGSGKIQRTLDSMLKQMELSEQEIKYRIENFDNVDVVKEYLKYLKCTRCSLNFQKVINKGEPVGVHPLLGVLLCNSCCDYYGDGNFSLDSEGEDKYCRWCGEGGTIFSCSKCICGFCDICIEKHFGEEGLEAVKNDDDWICYFCNPQPLWCLRSICSLAKEASNNKQLQINKENQFKSVKKKRRKKENTDELSKISSGSSSGSSMNASSYNKQTKRKSVLRHKEKLKREDSSSSEDEKENQVKSKRKLIRRKKQKILKEGSDSEAKSSKRNSRVNSEKYLSEEFESKRGEVIEKLRSIWKLTQTITQVGLSSSQTSLKSLSRTNRITNMEILKKEHEKLKSCMNVLMSSLRTASNSVDSIKEDLTFDTAIGEREIFQSQETKLKILEKIFQDQYNHETSIDSDEDSSSKEIEKKRTNSTNKKNNSVINKQNSEEKEEGEIGKSVKDERGKRKSVSLFSDSGSEEEMKKRDENKENRDSVKEIDSEKPLLKVKSFARMLDENAYDKFATTKRKTKKNPVVIDLLDVDSDESENEKKRIKHNKQADTGKNSSEKYDENDKEEKPTSKTVESEEICSTNDGSKKSPCREVEQKESNDESKTDSVGEEVKSADDREKKSVADEDVTTNRGDSSDGEENKKIDKQKIANDDNNECSEDNEESGKEKKEEEKNNKTEREKSSDSDSDGKDKPLSGEESQRKKTDSSEGGKKSSGEEQVVRKTRNQKKKKKTELKATFELYKQKRDRFLKSAKENLKKSDGEKGKVKAATVLDSSSESGSEKKAKGKKSDGEKEKVKAATILDSSSESGSEKKAKGKKSDGEKEKVKAATILDSSSESGSEKKAKGKKSEKQKKNLIFDSSDDEVKDKKNEEKEEEEEEEPEKENQKSESEATKPSSDTCSSDDEIVKKKRKRIRRRKSSDSSEDEPNKSKKKRIKNSSGSSGGEETNKKKKGRRNIKKILKKDSLLVETKEALKNEEERKKRVQERRKLFEELFPSRKENEKSNRIVLDFDPETKEPLVSVHKKLAKKLKPHQVDGVRFMWDNCFESVQKLEEESGSGCILAHCMGLGKTLQVVTLVHTVMTHDLGVNSVLITCPLSTVSNWIHEFEMWLENVHTEPIILYDLQRYKRREERQFHLEDWHKNGGVLVLSYDLFRNLTKEPVRKVKKARKKPKFQQAFDRALLDPGPDLVICDEGHLLKNEDTALSKCMTRIKTSRRIILTGTPLQNNLIEYHCMVQFAKPNILGTKKEFSNRFVNPINNGQFEDSTDYDVKIMKRRSHVLHSMLDGCVQRFDYSVLTPFLPEKQEYVISISLTETQAKTYLYFINNLSGRSLGSSRTASLFNDYHTLQRIWTHPRTLLMQSERESQKEVLDGDSEGSLKDFVVSSDESSTSEDSTSSSSVQEVTSNTTTKKRVLRSNANDPEVMQAIEEEKKALSRHWWDEFYSEEAYDDLREGNKLVILFSLLKYCEKLKEKILVFSQSLYSLDLIEYFLAKIDENSKKDNEFLCGHQDSWVRGVDYFRLDGSTTSDLRAIWCKHFNKESNSRARLFLISTRAGGLGINLYGANRVVIFDVSWNPSHDLQSIFRVYRFGQKKPCFIYRFLSEATMEEKIYERQVTKLSLAHRVVDEHQIERHYTMGNLQELYNFEPTPKEKRKIPKVPKDTVLADLLSEHKDVIVCYHEHDSLLENKQEEELSEEERKAAWKEYEEEKAQKTFNMDAAVQQQMFLMQQAQFAQGLQVNPLYFNQVNPGQSFLNMAAYLPPNIPLEILQRGIQVGVSPLPHESADAYLLRVFNRESWMQAGKGQTS